MAFRQHIQGSMCSPDHVNISHGYWEWFFFGHVELNSGFSVITINEIPFDRPQIDSGDCLWSTIVSNGWDLSDCLWRSSTCSSLCARWSWIELDFRKTWSLLDNLTVPFAIGDRTSLALSLRARIFDVSRFSSSSVSATRISPFQIPSA